MPDAPPSPDFGSTVEQPAEARSLTPEQIERTLSDFRRWLTELGSNRSPEISAPVPVDLFTLVGQFTALRHEVNLQTKATRGLIDQVAEDRKAPSGPEHDEGLRPLVKAMIDAADALALGLKNVEKLRDSLETQFELAAEPIPAMPESPSPGLFARILGAPTNRELGEWADAANDRIQESNASDERVRPLLAGLADGYALSLRRIERELPAFGLDAMAVVGQSFDPETMEAVEVVASEEHSSGQVVDEIRRGYNWNGRVFRCAQVSVAR